MVLFNTNKEQKKKINLFMKSLKNLNKLTFNLQNTNCKKSIRFIIKNIYKNIEKKVLRLIITVENKGFPRTSFLPDLVNDRNKCNYYSDERIAVYTCIVGDYDDLKEPIYIPDNCDFFVVTDSEVDENSVWKKISISDYQNKLESMTNVMRNRYFKFHPHIIFSNYKYSIYVDGTFQIVSDLTEHVNRMNSKYGLAHFKHQARDCAYQEILICKYLRKVSFRQLNLTKRHFEENGFPKNYGLLANGIIVRDHHNPKCIEVMDMWWEEFSKYAERDQLYLPFVLYKLGIKIGEIATLGVNIHEDYSFRIMKHLNK